MELTTYVRKPFVIEAVEITKENMEEIAEHMGTYKVKADGTPYIQIDRKLVPNVYRAYIGFWMTMMGDNIRCYSERVFKEQFIDSDPNTMAWVEFINGKSAFDAEAPSA